MVVLLALAGCEEPSSAPNLAPAAVLVAAAGPAHAAPAGAATPVAAPAPVEPAVAEPVLTLPPPLSEAQRAALLAGGDERIVSKREHFTVSNEYRHDLWFPYLRGLGGAYVGGASDQNYTLMAVARLR